MTRSAAADSAGAFGALLARLSADGGDAQAYEALRRRLIQFFKLHVPAEADDLADVVLDRLARRIHEGIDVEAIRPGPAEPFALPDGPVIAPGAPVVTHVNNQMEPMRGLHVFARALPRTMLIEEMEALWAPIAEADDWSEFHRVLGEIEHMREAYAGDVKSSARPGTSS